MDLALVSTIVLAFVNECDFVVVAVCVHLAKPNATIISDCVDAIRSEVNQLRVVQMYLEGVTRVCCTSDADVAIIVEDHVSRSTRTTEERQITLIG